MAKEKMKSTLLTMFLCLFIITAIAASALSLIYKATKGPIDEQKTIKLESALSKVLPTTEYDELLIDTIIPEGADPSSLMREGVSAKPLLKYTAVKGDEIIGVAVQSMSGNGFGGEVWIMVGFYPDGRICNTAVLEHKETPGLGDKMDIAKSNFPLQFMDKNPNEFNITVKQDGGDVDAITASTISSRAFCGAVNTAVGIAFPTEKGENK